MTQDELRKQHSVTPWGMAWENVEKHASISIEFATKCMHDVLKRYNENMREYSIGHGKFKSIGTIIVEKVSEINTKQP